MVDLVNATQELILLLRRVVDVEKIRRRQLNDLVEGVLMLKSDAERERLSAMSAEVRMLLETLGWERQRSNGGGLGVGMVRAGDGRDVDHLPSELHEAYELLWDRTYERVASGGSGGGGKDVRKGGVAKRPVIRDHAAFDMKRKVDKRLRRLAGEVRGYLSSGKGNAEPGWIAKCSGCGRVVDIGWRYCSWCGLSRMGERKES